METNEDKIDGIFHQYGPGRMYITKDAFLDDFGKIITESELNEEGYLEEDENAAILVSFEMLQETVHALHCKLSPSFFEAITSPLNFSSSSKSIVKKTLYKVIDRNEFKHERHEVHGGMAPSFSSSSSKVYRNGTKAFSKSWTKVSSSTMNENNNDDDDDNTKDTRNIDGFDFPPHTRKYSVEKLKLPMKRTATTTATTTIINDSVNRDDDDDDNEEKLRSQSPEMVKKSRTKRPKQLTPKQELSDHYNNHSISSSPDMNNQAENVTKIFDLIENWDEVAQRCYPNALLQEYVRALGIYYISLSLSLHICIYIYIYIYMYMFTL